jgi:hypothetical protein
LQKLKKNLFQIIPIHSQLFQKIIQAYFPSFGHFDGYSTGLYELCHDFVGRKKYIHRKRLGKDLQKL